MKYADRQGDVFGSQRPMLDLHPDAHALHTRIKLCLASSFSHCRSCSKRLINPQNAGVRQCLAG
jgi:hypothetical protein